MHPMLRFLSALFGALIFGSLVPVVYLLLAHGVPFDHWKGFVLLAGAGVVLGAVLEHALPALLPAQRLGRIAARQGLP